MNLLDLVPAFDRQLREYRRAQDTDSTLAAYLADAVEALNYRWTRDYVVENTAPLTFEVEPTIAAKDKRPVILMASIIYKSGNLNLVSFRDGDFAWDPQQGRTNPLQVDLNELDKILPSGQGKLAVGITAPLRGYANVYNREAYNYFLGIL